MRPLLAATIDKETTLKFPYLASPKLDGIRCLIHPELGPVSRNLKPIPNYYIREVLSYLPNGWDGEIIVGAPYGDGVFNRTTSAVMSHNGEPDFTFHVFDNYLDRGHFAERIGNLNKITMVDKPVVVVPHIDVCNVEELLATEAKALQDGYEGIMLRDPFGPYKFGRSTLRENTLLKVKRFEDYEGTIIGFRPKFQNTNAATIGELGQTTRSKRKEGMVELEELGAFICQCDGYVDPFEIGTGFTQEQRDLYWAHQDSLMGAIVKFKAQPYGELWKPRFPVFLGFRDPIDL